MRALLIIVVGVIWVILGRYFNIEYYGFATPFIAAAAVYIYDFVKARTVKQ